MCVELVHIPSSLFFFQVKIRTGWTYRDFEMSFENECPDLKRVTYINSKPQSVPGLCSFLEEYPSLELLPKVITQKVQSRTAHKKLRTGYSRRTAPKSKCRGVWAY